MKSLGSVAKVKCPCFPGEVRDQAEIGFFVVKSFFLAFVELTTL